MQHARSSAQTACTAYSFSAGLAPTGKKAAQSMCMGMAGTAYRYADVRALQGGSTLAVEGLSLSQPPQLLTAVALHEDTSTSCMCTQAGRAMNTCLETLFKQCVHQGCTPGMKHTQRLIQAACKNLFGALSCRSTLHPESCTPSGTLATELWPQICLRAPAAQQLCFVSLVCRQRAAYSQSLR